MTRLERTAERRAYSIAPLKRVSWGAIFSGALISIAMMTVLGVLGVAIGAMSIGTGNETSNEILGVAAGIWWVVSGMIALFAGGMAASRLAGLSRRWEAPLHGVVTWALATVTTLALTTTLVAGMSRHGDRVGRMGPAMAPAAADVSELVAQSDLPEAVWQDIRREGHQLIRLSARKLMLKPAASESEEARMMSTADMLSSALDEFDTAVARLNRAAKTAIAPGDKIAVVDVLVSRTNMDRQEAQTYVDRWAMQMDNAWGMAKQGLVSRSHEMHMARVLSGAPNQGVSGAAWFSFIYLLMTALAAGLGGMLGAPNHRVRQPPAVEVTQTSSTQG